MDIYKEPLDLVMLVDDDSTTNYLNERLLKEMQVAKQIVIMNNGREAIDYLKAAEAGNEGLELPDLIFLDIKMPVMDGFSFLDAYQKEGLDMSDKVIILMLTSSASFYDLERLRNYRKVKQHFSKALTKHDIRQIMSEYFSSKA
ncbi:CheY-like chemotaxis protein [Pontibacter aydingkolensis]|uniref:Response regulator n=1 Tax=Pontibacter aydingkolensis TaxID=1911536 RepID=A0ABS7CUN4_9BACT|nr:response regulator [Pontibacter aydingkolensis]MBW7467574.1 response regulator [Pontibacter aydingkolensis]